MAEHSNTLVTVKSNQSLQTETEAQPKATDDEQNEKAFSPTLICESTVEAIPPNLQNIIESLNSCGGSSSNKTDLLICVIYVLMIETGFVPIQYKDMFDDGSVDFHIGHLQSLIFFPETWKQEINSYNFNFVLLPFPDRVCKMQCFVINQNLTINALLRPTNKFCMQLLTNKYITHEDIQPISFKFNKLNELSIEFKNKVALLARNTILTIEGVPHASLQELPSEIIYKIFFEQDAVDFIHLKNTSRRMQECAKFFEHDLWKHYFKRDFPRASRMGSEKWDDKYKQEIEIRRMRRRREEAMARRVKRKPFFAFHDII